MRLVYKFPKARIFTNSVLSEEFTLERGTRQGCPLSPLLFALAMEPLAERIRQDQQITGITMGEEQYKLNLFADDLLMYLNNFDESIQPLLTIFNEYSMVSGYKINLGKTEVMAVGKSKNTVNTLRQAFKWTSKIKYLGCNINISKKQIYNDTYIPLLNSMQSEMNKWSNLPLNITGRINLFKMMWLPKFPQNLFSYLFSKAEKNTSANFMVRNLAASWRKMKSLLRESITLPKQTLLWNNPWITLQNKVLNWSTWRERGIETVENLMNGNKFISWTDFKSRYDQSNGEFFRYMQLRSLFQSFDLEFSGQHSELEKLIFNSETCHRLTGKVYKILQKSYLVDILLKSRTCLWNQDLGREDINSKWEQCWNITRDITVNENLRLIQYKIMYRIYCTRDKMHKYDGKVSNNCLECGTPDSPVHAFWECYKVQKT